MKLKAALPFAVFTVLSLVAYLGCSSDDNGTEPVTTGTLEVNSTPAGAQIFIDGEDKQKQTPYAFSKVKADSHDITLELEHHEVWDTTVYVTAGVKTSVNGILTESKYTLSVGTSGNGTVTVTPLKDQYDVYDTVILTQEADSGWGFESWEDTVTSSGDLELWFGDSLIVEMNRDKSIAAAFVGLAGRILIRGDIDWPDHILTTPIAFLDTSHTDTISPVYAVLADSGGNFTTWFITTDSIEAFVWGADDINGDNIINGSEEPLGWYDADADQELTYLDMIMFIPGQKWEGLKIILKEVPEGVRMRPSIGPIRLNLQPGGQGSGR